jgi:hypothetical protein
MCYFSLLLSNSSNYYFLPNPQTRSCSRQARTSFCTLSLVEASSVYEIRCDSPSARTGDTCCLIYGEANSDSITLTYAAAWYAIAIVGIMNV